MSRQKYRGNVLPASFPLLSSFSGHSVVVPQIDQYYINRASNQQDNFASEKLGIPHTMFMENVMPVSNGLSSIGFTQAVPPFVGEDVDSHFDQAYWLRDWLEKRTLFVPAHGLNYIFDAETKTWSSTPIFVPRESEVSVATIKQRTFVCYSKYLSFFEWIDNELKPIVFRALTAEAVNGLVAANTYLVAYTDDTILWSSVLDPTDFFASLETGAGSSKILSVKGKILYCVQLSDGFLIYTTFNSIAATYTGNPNFPWTFKEIPGSCGVDEVEEITKDTNTDVQYANSQAGLMRLDKSSATLVWPEIAEFLNCRRIERYDYDLKKIVEKNLLDALVYKIALVANRFLVVSYGYYALEYALIFDNSLNRWGKVRIDHVDCFDFVGHPAAEDDSIVPALRYIDLDPRTYEELTETYEEFGGVLIPGTVGKDQRPYKSLAFLKQSGEVVIIDFDLTHKNENAVLYLGRYQLLRNRFMDLFEVWAERMSSEVRTKLAILSSLDGSTIDKTTYPMKDPKTSKTDQQVWLVNLSAHNYIFRFEGHFDLHNLELVFDSAGYR